ncbi:MAG: toll/interleukin-1 receptor domain-containing protein, partial [Hyphomonadaceae bacterium]|nr:toll/interleukin-1 receptor domain-containing protein [Hyphomonadaceae bacterium]
MADVFISYKREDRRVAERISIALEQLGFNVWWDFELLSGDEFRRVIEKVIDQCAATLVLWSQLSRESTFVVDEATYARAQGKLCPARIDDCRLPLGFGGDHVIDLSNWDGELGHDGLQQILRALEAKTGKKARLGARARDDDERVRFAEMEAFKVAQAAQNASALRTFLRDFPNGAFANFVRGQLEEMATAQPQPAAAAPQPAYTPPPPQSPPPPAPPYTPPHYRPSPVNYVAPEPPPRAKPPWPLIGGGAAALVAVVALVFVLTRSPSEAPPTTTSPDVKVETPSATAPTTPAPDAAAEEAARLEIERLQREISDLGREISQQGTRTPPPAPASAGPIEAMLGSWVNLANYDVDQSCSPNYQFTRVGSQIRWEHHYNDGRGWEYPNEFDPVV